MRAIGSWALLVAVGGLLGGCGGDGSFLGWPEPSGSGGAPPLVGAGGTGGLGPDTIIMIDLPALGELDRSLAQLHAAASCEELLEPLRLRLLVAVDAALQQNREYLLTLARGSCPQSELVALDGGGAVVTPAVPVPAESSGADSYTTTNLQDSAVDEADFVKNDAEHLYVLADGALQILRAWPAEETTVVARVALEGTP
ncbi:MAG TPA: beta-propeller domain-containing protein, partial [Polyangiaceae bacterium]|nr:beta-propeller domain-containing protein [Polyangiaceae bacterium]